MNQTPTITNSWHDTWRKIHMQKTKCFVAQSVWLHYIRACS
jgi:hypothetical protein